MALTRYFFKYCLQIIFEIDSQPSYICLDFSIPVFSEHTGHELLLVDVVWSHSLTSSSSVLLNADH